MNITELARRLKITPNELKDELPKLGFHIGPRAIQIPDKQARQVIDLYRQKKEKEQALEKAKKKIVQKKEKEEEKEKKEEKIVRISSTIQVYKLAEKLNLPVVTVMNELIKNGVLSSVNENLDYEIAAIVAQNLGFSVEKGEEEEKETGTLVKQKFQQALKSTDKKELRPRAPVVVVMGHVDHGKSSILSAIREIDMISREKGGITQHIGAYSVTKNDHEVTFIDTPGHEAFESMRARGGEVADIATLVISADDKIQPQTLESIKVIQNEGLPFIVAINKIDKPDADVEKIKKELSEINLTPEDWGGKVITIPVSAKTKQGIEDLLEMINLVAEMHKDTLVTNPNGTLIGTVIESYLDHGYGPVATLILYNGTLRRGENVIIDSSYGRIRSIKDQWGKSLESVGASMPVQIFGLKNVPQVGDIVEVVKNNREFKKRIKQIRISAPAIESSQEKEVSKVPQLKVIVRADVLGSLEAIIHSLEKLEHPEVKIKVVKKGLANITESDVDLSQAAHAWIIGFGVDIGASAKQLAHELRLKISLYSVIYDLIQEVKQEINKLLPEEVEEEELGKVEILKVFQHKGKETIAGGKVVHGKVIKNVLARVWAEGGQELKGEGEISQLQVNKRDVDEVKEGSECGMKFVGNVD
ncbi:translation initiation factor IF-2, partial [Patescibacteria group bacterium AH-259-L07]|nr:translation initiation factor IF-2 [Patescibacteria group bacterium AH-259-L07]